MNDEEPRPFDQVAKLDLYEHPETGAELVAAYTEDGEEYVITNKKMVRKLIKYVEDDIDIRFQGTVTEDPYVHIQILDVDDYEPLQEFHELKPLESVDEVKCSRAAKRRQRDAEEEDFEGTDLDEGYHHDENFDDPLEEGDTDDLDNFLKDTEFEELDDSMFEEDLLDEDISEEEKQRLQDELDNFVRKPGRE